MVFIYLVLMAVVFGPFGVFVAAQKHRAVSEGAILGVLFGPLGVLVEALLPQGSVRGGNGTSKQVAARNIDELGIIATISDRFRTALERVDPDWERLPYRRKRELLRPVEKQLVKELRLSPSDFFDYAAEARRLLPVVRNSAN